MAIESTRAPITVALVIDTDRSRPKHVFDALSPHLRNGDNAVVLGPRSSADHPGSWWETRARRAVRVDAVMQPHELVLVLDADVGLADGCIDELLAHYAGTPNSAVVPRAIGAGAFRRDGAAGGLAALRAGRPDSFAQDPRDDVEGLGDACVLLSREALLAAGGFEALRTAAGVSGVLGALAAADGSIEVVHAALARRPARRGLRGDRLISACMIVRDEAPQLVDCLQSLRPIVDEIVVYDTGSEDRTRELARALGARVVAGYWDDDFARARNDALVHCDAHWILWVDADERVIDTDAGALRTLLTGLGSEIDALLVPIDNLRGNEASTVLTHAAVRLFRREVCHWAGRLHEQIVRHDSQSVRVVRCTTARLLHRGYLDSVMQARGKRGRNMRSALSELAGGSELDLPTRLVTLGRSHMMAGRQEEGVVLCRWALERHPGDATRRLALRALGDAYIFLERYDDALAVAEELRGPGGVPELAAIIAGRARLGLGENEAALTEFASVQDGHDVDGFEYGPHLVADKHARALLALERPGDAANVLLETLRRRGGIDTHLGLLIEALDATGRDFAEIVDAVGDNRLRAFLPPLLQIESAVGDRVLESWFARQPSYLPLLATAAEVATRLDIARQLVWSARLRHAGFADSCPLIRTAVAAASPATDRVIAGAVAATVFGDGRGDLAFGAGVHALTPDERRALHPQLCALSPTHGDRLAALPATAALLPAPTLADGAKHVVVLSRRAEELRNVVLAARTRQLGHSVTLLAPAPKQPAADRYASLGVLARTWHEGADWTAAALSALARLYAIDTIDLVVLGCGTESLAERVQGLIPGAVVLADADGPGIGGAPLAPSVFPPAPIERVATGLLAVADLRGLGEESTGRGTAALRAVRAAVPDAPIVVCGDDPHGAAHNEVGDAIEIGTCTDPRPWLSACSALLLLGASEHNAAEWLALAATSETPAFVLGAEEDPEVFARRVTRGRADAPPVERLQARGADRLLHRLPTRPRRGSRTDRRGGRPLVRLTSDVSGLGSLSQVNRELAARLADPTLGFTFELAQPKGSLPPQILTELAHVSFSEPPSRETSVEIRHQWPPDFSPPAEGMLVLIQPFEFGGFPAEWVGALRDIVDELWVPSNWVRDCAIDSGVPATKVSVVPNGVDVTRYRQAGAKYPLQTTKRTRLLFVGGCIPRKGFDALLEVYLATFTREDDVCLVVKPFGGADVYAGSTLEADLRRAAASDGPEIEIVDQELGLDEMATLYRSCDALVHPYRGEGFALPVAEALACGLPAVVTSGGACDDFCDEEVAWMLPARRVPIQTAAFTPSPPGAWWLEPDREALARALREIVAGSPQTSIRGARGAERIAAAWTWDAAAKRATERLVALLGLETTTAVSAQPTPTPTGRQR